MAFLPNPYYGSVPGAPAGLNWWDQNRFMMSGLPPPPVVVAPAPPPPPPLAPTVTPQDVAAAQAVTALANSTGRGAEPGGGGPGGGPGGLGPGAYPGQPNPGMGGGVGTPGGDTTFSGYPGVYAQAPDELDSQFGTGLGMAGAAVPFPGAGTALGAIGGAIDAARYNGINAQYGVPGTVNPWGSAAAAALAGIGVPFTDWNLAHLFGVPTARERQNALLDAYGQPLSRGDMGYGAFAANESRAPGAPFGNTGWAAGMDPTTSQYPSGFGLNEVALAAPGIIAANPDIFGARPTATLATTTPTPGGTTITGSVSEPGKGAFDAGGWGEALGGKGGSDAQSTGSASDKGDTSRDSSADTSREGGSDAYKYRGGLIGPPPGRYERGGVVRPPARQSIGLLDILRFLRGDGAAEATGDLRNSIFGAATAALPMPAYDDERRLQRRLYDMPQLELRQWEPEIPTRTRVISPGVSEVILGRPGQYSVAPDPGFGRGGPDDAGETRSNRSDDTRAKGSSTGAYAAGGPVPQPGDNISPAAFGLLRAINPPGPDDQIGALQTGEGVITAGAMKRYPGLLAAANAGTLDPGRVKGLLAPAPAARPRRLR